MPQRRQSLFPFLRYDDPDAALRWLAEAFGCTEHAVHRGPDGGVVHAEVRCGSDLLMLGPAADDALGMDSPRRLGKVTQGLYVAVDDPDAHHARARAAGAEIVLELKDTDYGSREYSARDPEGHLWSFGTYRPGDEGAAGGGGD